MSMVHDPAAARYAQAAFEAAKAEGRVAEARRELAAVGDLIRADAALRRLLRNPDVTPEDKAGLLDRVSGGAWSALVRAFIRMTAAAGRAEALPDIAEAFGALVDADEGRLRVAVRSVHPLPEAVLHRLRGALERREGKRVELSAELDPALLGGMQVRLDHRIVDGSVRRQLAELRRRLSAIRVA